MGTDSVIYIRTDGNSNIATGHLVRCLCIAQALESLGKSVCFLVSDTDSSTLLQDLAASIFPEYSFSFNVKILETAVYDNLELEIEELKTILTSDNRSLHTYEKATLNQTLPQKHQSRIYSKPVVFVDSYFVTEHYFSSLREFARIAYMDDLRAFDYNVDMIINYDVIPPDRELEYQQTYKKAGITLLGAKYTPLRTQFQNQNVVLQKEIKSILITTGGSDPYHFSETLICHLLSMKLNIDFHVVVGKLFQDTNSLEELANQNTSVHLHYNVSDMAALMKQCDYAVSAAGTTLYELCALGIPAISFSMADNQIPMAETFAETKAVPYAGDIRIKMPEEMNIILSRISKHLLSLFNDPSKAKNQHQSMRHLIDGTGAIKIAEALCKL